jgi:hypothetical protein
VFVPAALTFPAAASPAQTAAALANASSALLAMRCDYADLASLPASNVLITSGNCTLPGEQAAFSAAIAAAGAAACPSAASLALRRQLAAPGGDRGRALAVATATWANVVVVLIPASAASGAAQAIVAAVAAATTAASFPRTTAVWAPAWDYTPAAWASQLGSPVATAGPVTVLGGTTLTPTPSASALATVSLASLGLGLGLGIGIPVLFAAAAVVWFHCVHRRAAAIHKYAAPAAAHVAEPDLPTKTAHAGMLTDT